MTMPKKLAENTRLLRDYLDYLEHGLGRNDATIDATAGAINRYLAHTKNRSLKKFHREQAVAYVRHLKQQTNPKTGKPLSIATIESNLSALQKFFTWLAGQSGYRRNVTYADASYFRLSGNETRIAKARRDKPVPTLEQLHSVLAKMPHMTDLEKRNRAVVAFITLTGARDGAVASFQLGDVDCDRRCVVQDARHVRTKRAKTFTTIFYPVGGDAEEIVVDWCTDLRERLLWSETGPMFPATKVQVAENGGFAASGLSRTPWTSAGPIRKIFREAFDAAGLPYCTPHTVRKTLTLLGQKLCKTAEDFKAWSQNMGHDSPLTTFTSYGTLSFERQAEVFESLSEQPASTGVDEQLKEMAKLILARD